MAVTRTVELTDLSSHEVAELFGNMDSHQQAEFFARIHVIAKGWSGAGLCQQSHDIAKSLSPDGRETITKLAEHVLGYDEMLSALHQYESDLLYPPTGDSLERRLERVRKVIALARGEA